MTPSAAWLGCSAEEKACFVRGATSLHLWHHAQVDTGNMRSAKELTNSAHDFPAETSSDETAKFSEKQNITSPEGRQVKTGYDK